MRKSTHFDEKRAFQVPRFQLIHVWFVVRIETSRVVAGKPVEIFVKCPKLSTNTVNRD